MRIKTSLVLWLCSVLSLSAAAQTEMFTDAFDDFSSRRLWEFEEIPIKWKMEGLLQADLNKTIPLPQGHAHNDYEHDRPLFEALENGFTSVEADVHLIDGRLLVSHERPADTTRAQTLEELYLRPLRDHVRKNDGRIYDGYEDFFYLMVDLKTAAGPTYDALRDILVEYADILSVAGDSVPGKPVKVLVSGNRPVATLLDHTRKYAALDGRPEDLGKGIAPSLMPLISQSYGRYLSWQGDGPVDERELDALRKMVDAAHHEGKRVRLWGAPDNPEAWGMLLDAGIDVINTDKLSQLRDFLLSRH